MRVLEFVAGATTVIGGVAVWARYVFTTNPAPRRRIDWKEDE